MVPGFLLMHRLRRGGRELDKPVFIYTHAETLASRTAADVVGRTASWTRRLLQVEVARVLPHGSRSSILRGASPSSPTKTGLATSRGALR